MLILATTFEPKLTSSPLHPCASPSLFSQKLQRGPGDGQSDGAPLWLRPDLHHREDHLRLLPAQAGGAEISAQPEGGGSHAHVQTSGQIPGERDDIDVLLLLLFVFFLMQRVILWAAFSRLVKIKNTKCVLAEQILCKSKSLQLVKVILTWGNGRININGISTGLVQQSPNVKYKQSLNNLKTIASNLSCWLVVWNFHSVHSCIPANI